MGEGAFWLFMSIAVICCACVKVTELWTAAYRSRR